MGLTACRSDCVSRIPEMFAALKTTNRGDHFDIIYNILGVRFVPKMEIEITKEITNVTKYSWCSSTHKSMIFARRKERFPPYFRSLSFVSSWRPLYFI
jgi:hypothetical protein